MLSSACWYRRALVAAWVLLLCCTSLACSFEGASGSRGNEGFVSSETESSVYVQTERRVIEKVEGKTFEAVMEKTLDQQGNVIAYDYTSDIDGAPNSEISPTHVTLGYDSLGVAISCEGTDQWTQEVTQWTDENLPLAVQRTRPSGAVSEFLFEYYPSGQVRGFTVASPFSESEYEFDEEGRLVYNEFVYIDDEGGEHEPIVRTWEYSQEDSANMRITQDLDGQVFSTLFVCDEHGLRVSGSDDSGEGASTESFLYQRVDNPSPIARLWSRCLMGSYDGICPLSDPAF